MGFVRRRHRTGKNESHRVARGSGRRGFTVIEVLVAVTILGLAYVAILQNFSVSMKNLVRLESSRNQLMEDQMAFMQKLHPQEEEGETQEIEEGPSFLEGHYFRLVLIKSETGNFETLILEKL